MTVNNKALGKNITEENITEKVWFVDVVTEYGPGHFVPTHITLERCAEILNAGYLAVVDQDCPFSIGTEKWLRVLQNSRNPTLHDFAQLAEQRQFYRAFFEIKTQINAFFELAFRIRSLIKNINNNASSIVIHLDTATPLQIAAVWLSVASLLGIRYKIVIWTHIHRTSHWQETKIGRLVRCLFNAIPIKTWNTTYTSEMAAENKKYGWVDVLPLPLNPALDAVACVPKSINKINDFSERSDRLICWLLVTRPEQGLDLVPNMIGHKTTRNFTKKFIKCFVSEWANIQGNDDVEVVRVPYGADNYHLLFGECDVVLLPYNAHSFGDAMSMVFIEAVAMGKIPIVSDGTVMARELRRFKLSDLVLDFSNEFSWTLINEVREDIGILARLNLMAECYRREHDAFAYAEAIYQNLKQRNSIMGLTETKRI